MAGAKDGAIGKFDFEVWVRGAAVSAGRVGCEIINSATGVKNCGGSTTGGVAEGGSKMDIRWESWDEWWWGEG